MKKKYRTPIILGATVLPTDDDGVSIVFGNSQGTFGSNYTFTEDAWDAIGYILVDLSDDDLMSALQEMDTGDHDRYITLEEANAWLDNHEEYWG